MTSTTVASSSTRSPRATASPAAACSPAQTAAASYAYWGITISRPRDGRILEDYSTFDWLELLRQLGLWRTVLAAPRMLRDGRRNPSAAQ